MSQNLWRMFPASSWCWILQALDKLYDVIDHERALHMEGALIVAGDFNKANLKKVLPKYYWSVDFLVHGDNILDHVYISIPRCLQMPPLTSLQQIISLSVLLLPVCRSRLKHEQPMMDLVQHWTNQSHIVLRPCFRTTEWCAFQTAANNNVNKHTEYAAGYINKCIDDVVLRLNVQTWIKKQLKDSAGNSGVFLQCLKTRHMCRKVKTMTDYKGKS